MKRTKTLSLLALLVMICLCVTVALAACKGDDSGLTLDKTEVSVVEGSMATIKVDTNDTGEDIVWTVDKTDVVQIIMKNNTLCSIRGLKAGTAVLTATAGEITATCTVTVTASNVDRVTITKDGTTVSATEVVRGETITLVATSSKGSTITGWESSDEDIATVEGGVVTGVAPGVVTITAKVSETVKGSVTVTVTAAQGDDFYELTLDKGAADAAANPGVWAYWTEWAAITTKNYYNGTVNLEFSNNAGNWYNLQLFYVDSTISASKYYKLTLDIDSDAAGRVTINGFVLELKTGKHSYDVYFKNGTGISMQFGVENVGIDIAEAKISISNIHFEEDTSRVTLVAPSFTYDAETGIITIQDTNSTGVKGYTLNLYQEGSLVTAVSVAKSGEEVDWSLVESGTYEAKLIAVAANVHYIDSPESAAQTIKVENEGGLHYTFDNSTPTDGGGARAKQTPGIWTYWSESWVSINGEFADGKLTFTFSNNAGNWYDTQLNYRHPGLENGKLYKLQLQITSNADDGRVTLNAAEFTIKKGTHTYDIVFTEDGGLSIQITFGLDGQNNAQEIKAATMEFVILGVEETQKTELVAPTFTLDSSNVISIVDSNQAGVVSYELGFFQGEELKATVTVQHGQAVDLSTIVAGSYIVRLRAVAAANSLFTTSVWSTSQATIESANETVTIPVQNGDEASAVGSPDAWREWHDQDWCGSIVSVSKCEIDNSGKLDLTYSVTKGSCWFGMQLFIKYSNCQAGQQYKLTMKINSSVAGNITVCGQVIELQVGNNDVDVTFTHGDKATLSIQFGVESASSMIMGGTFSLSEISVTAA